MHDSTRDAGRPRPDEPLALVGTPGNTSRHPGSSAPGTFLGSSDIEGFQAGNFIQILDNQAAQWLPALTTTDGATLGGFASLSRCARLQPGQPARAGSRLRSRSPRATTPAASRAPRAIAIASADSHLLDLAGLLGAFSSVYALTDQSNAQVGGSQPARAYFDGDPFPVQNQTPTGQRHVARPRARDGARPSR